LKKLSKSCQKVVKELSKNGQIVCQKVVKSCQKDFIKLSKSWQKVVKKLVKILKRVGEGEGEEGGGGEKGDL
jgi:hypothetical protein